MKKTEKSPEKRSQIFDKEQVLAIGEPLVLWYEKNARDLPWRRDRNPYGTWVSEIMLQQTRVEAVRGYFLRFMEELPDIQALANVSDDHLMKLWEGLGYYSRARNLKKAAGVVVEKFSGKLPSSYEELLTLPGIGGYTAGAIASMAFGKPCPAVDGNVLRVLSRVTASREDIALPWVKKAAEEVLKETIPADKPGEFNQAVMDLGAMICIPNGAPKCEICPLQDLCRAKALGIQEELPVKSGKKARKSEALTVLLLRFHDRILLRKRGNKGLLAGLWELPNVPGYLDLPAVSTLLRDWGLSPEEIVPLPDARHIFSHIQWEMRGFECKVGGVLPAENFPEGLPPQPALPAAPPQVEEPSAVYSRDTQREEPSWVWASMEDLRAKYSLPSAFQAYRPKDQERNDHA
ncbi:MAG: A/G-specific adenine glycosylase [Firmicutes bacterium]|nr:A/G-specific adenine glycosylase [Bacillota bacterium]